MSRHNRERRQRPGRRPAGTVLPQALQHEIAEASAKAHRERYPDPPRYRPAHNAPQPEQPDCYLLRRWY